MNANMGDHTEWSHQRRHEQLRNSIPLRPIAMSGDNAPLVSAGVVMMANDWIPSEIPEQVLVETEVDLEEFEKQLQKMHQMIPDWATESAAGSGLGESAEGDLPLR